MVWHLPRSTCTDTLFPDTTFVCYARETLCEHLGRCLDGRLDVVWQRLPSELSGGQQQRVAVARALVLEPAVLLFDEPLSNLDAKLRRRVREDIRELQQKLGLTSVYVTHDPEEAMAVSDRIIEIGRTTARERRCE